MEPNKSAGQIVLLVCGAARGRQVVSAHPDEDEAARALGRALLSGGVASPGPWSTETVPLVGAGLTGRLVVDVLEPVDEAQDQPDVDPSGAADLVARQCATDLAGALGLNEPRPWPDMCREARDHRHVAEDDEAQREKTAMTLSMPTNPTVPSWRAIRAQARRARDLGGESFVSALRNVLDDCGPGVADMTRPELLGQVRRLVETRPGRVHVDPEGLERAYRAQWERLGRGAWESAPGGAQAATVITVDTVVRAYLGLED